MAMYNSDESSSIVRLNIGGKKFCTTVDTLTQREPHSMLAAMFSGRHTVCKDSEGLVDGMTEVLNKKRNDEEMVTDLTRTGIIKCVQSENARLRGVNLSGLDLSGLNLSHVDFDYACLKNVSFSRAILLGATFKMADLTNANLEGADLKRANLWGAKLTNASLKGANLENAYLRNAYLIGTDLEGAKYMSREELRGAIRTDFDAMLQGR